MFPSLFTPRYWMYSTSVARSIEAAGLSALGPHNAVGPKWVPDLVEEFQKTEPPPVVGVMEAASGESRLPARRDSLRWKLTRIRTPRAAGKILANRVTELMRSLNVPNGLEAVGYTEADIPALVEGTLPQHRVTKLSPIPAGRDELTALFHASMRIW
jgi:hypothetical protein